MPDTPLALLTPEEATSIGQQLLSYTTSQAEVYLTQSIQMRTKFGRNDLRTMESEHTLRINLNVHVDGRFAGSQTTRTDKEGLLQAARAAEEAAGKAEKDQFYGVFPPPTNADFTDPAIYLDSSLKAGDSSFQGDTIRQSIQAAAAANFVAAGVLQVSCEFQGIFNSSGLSAYTRNAFAHFTATVRSKATKGSGWAWGGHEDFARVNPAAAMARAIDLCQKSQNPVAVEPGRYTVILEPEAAAQLLEHVHNDSTTYMSADAADQGSSVFSKQGGGNKIGLHMMDPRVQVMTDPHDPELPFSPLVNDGTLYSRTDWFTDGVLTNLALLPYYAKDRGVKPLWHPGGRAHYVIKGPTQSLEEMIAGTRRGIWVHHFGSVAPVTRRTLMLTGVTRDGTFLIENGKITKPIKNLRFNESPFFFMNKLDAFGPSVRASAGLVAPRLKVHDFEFTSMSDAI